MDFIDHSERDDLADNVSAFIKRGEDNEAGFNSLAQQIFAYQYARNAPYRRFCDGRGVTPESAVSWYDIPRAPAAAFKRFALTCAPENECTAEQGGRIFHSSGTTGADTSRHFMDAAALALYRVSLQEGFQRFVCGDEQRLPIMALMAPPEEAPHSSLSFMLGELIARHGGAFFSGDRWQERLRQRLGESNVPVVVFGTAFAFVHLFDTLGERLELPEGSRIVETGGFKGRSREIPRDELYALFSSRLGVSLPHCVAEYGMSEMASQFYDSILIDQRRGMQRKPRKIGPPWLKTRVLDPVTGKEAGTGMPGLLAHYDLANLNSTFALQTEDYGYREPDGGFTLLGRAPGAILRGCSLTAEELMQAVV